MINIKRSILIALLFLPAFVFAADLTEVELNDDDYLLLSVVLDKQSARVTIDSYYRSGQIFVAIEPLFSGLKLRYQLREDQLTIWKGEQKHIFSFLGTIGMAASAPNTWGTDGYYQYISQDVLEKLFDISLELDKPRSTLNIITQSYKFPITVLAEQAVLRSSNRAYSYALQQRNNQISAIPITIPDQYNLYTLPHGDVRTSMDFSNDKESVLTNVQLVSDLLYHSARFSFNHKSGQDLTGGLSFSRFKTTPDDRILGAFDSYRFGDVSSSLGAGIISGKSGVGMIFEREPDGYRRSNSKIDIEQDATPGWESELFLNGRFIAAATVPDTGLLIFEDIDIYYGPNEFRIKVFGPFAEVETYQQSYPLVTNPLADGEMAYNIHALDNTRSLFNNNNESGGLSINSMGGSFDYGFNDTWQLGLTFQDNMNVNNNQQLFSLHNYVNLPGFLLENELAFNADADFSQQTSLSGTIFGGAAFQLRYESNHDLVIADNVSFATGDFQRLTASYSNHLGNVPLIFRASFADAGGILTYTLSNNVNYTYKRLRFSHDLFFSKFEQKIGVENTKTSSDNITGNLGVSGQLFKDLRLSANLNYNPDATDFILDSSFFTAQYKWEGPFAYQHYFNFNYRPLAAQNNEWQLSHSVAYETTDYRLSFNSAYNAQYNWTVGLNVNFFLGYDHHNRRALTSSSISSESAMLNIHSYLDRQLNGVPDVLDYDLEDVEFQGVPEWEGLKSGEKGTVILPGVPVNTPFGFAATWKRGSKTINNDYVIYTHPGARIDVNMPFYLNTELAGFIYKNVAMGEIPVSELLIDLIDRDNNVVQQITTDSDGYFEFSDMQPNSYKVVMNVQDLRDKGLTAELLGYSLSTPSIGGFTELPVLYVRQLKNDDDRAEEVISDLILNEDNIELLVWDEDDEKRQNYFTLPTKQKIMASHSQNVALEKPISVAEEIAKLETVPVVIPKPSQLIIDNLNINPNNKKNDLLIVGFTLQLGAFMSFDSATVLTEYFKSRVPIKAKIIKTQNDKWQTIYKVYLGSFSQRKDANSFVKRYQLSASEYIITPVLLGDEIVGPVLETKVIETGALPKPAETFNEIETTEVDVNPVLNADYQTKKWVIQFYASQSTIDLKEVLPFAAIGDIFMAQKTDKQTGEMWYCLISKGFETKAQAEQAMQDANVGGWVNLSQYYSAGIKL
jgi:hypothetical protein